MGKRAKPLEMPAIRVQPSGPMPSRRCDGTSRCPPGKRRALDKSRESNRLIDELEKLKASIRAMVEHPFRVIKRQFGHVKVRYRGLAKNTAQLHMLFALSNLWMVRRQLNGAQA